MTDVQFRTSLLLIVGFLEHKTLLSPEEDKQKPIIVIEKLKDLLAEWRPDAVRRNYEMNLTQEDSPMSQPTDHTAVADEGHPAVVEYIRQIPKLVAITALTMTVALIGNLFLAFIIATSTRRRLNPVQILIIHTCIADIMFALCTILPQLATFLTFPIFYGNDFLCRCVKYLQVVPMYASPNLLMAISIDRYLAICKPLKAYRWKYHLCQWLAFSAWLLAFLLASPQIVTFQYGTYTNSTIYMCISAIEETWVEDLTITFFTSFAWLIPSIVVGVLYTLVCLQVWRSNKHCATPEVTSTSANNTTSRFFPNNDTNNGQSSHHHQSTKQHDKTTTVSLRKVHSTPISFYKIRTVKLTMTIVACNFLLMAPFCLINLLSALFPSVMETIGKFCLKNNTLD